MKIYTCKNYKEWPILVRLSVSGKFQTSAKDSKSKMLNGTEILLLVGTPFQYVFYGLGTISVQEKVEHACV